MANYTGIVDRIGTGGDLPKQMVNDVIGDIRTSATATQLGNVVTTETRDSRIPVLSQDLDAFWVNSDSALKGVSVPHFQSQSIYAEEMAVIVPVPDNVVADSSFGIWDALRPLIARAFARKLDRAVLFGVDSPSTWGPGLVQAATTAGHVVTGTDDPAADLLSAAELVANTEHTPSAAAVRNGFEFNAAITRTQAFQANPLTDSNPFPLSIAGMPIATGPVYWDAAAATAVVADWSNVIVGIREDIRFEMFKEGIITDDTGKVVMNLMQQDSQALRAVMRVGYMLRRPVIGANDPATTVAIVKTATGSHLTNAKAKTTK